MDLQQPVLKLMNTDVKTVFSSMPVRVAYDLLNTNSIHHLPVINEESGELAGIISTSDILYFLRPLDPESRESYLNDIRLKNYKIDEIMSTDFSSVSPSDSLEKALVLFAENKFHALPVTEQGKLVGIITTHDFILAALGRKGS